MAYRIELAPEGTFLSVVLEGRISVGDVRETLKAVGSHRDFSIEIPKLWDLRGADFGDWSSRDTQSIAVHVTLRYPERKRSQVAIVAERDLEYALARAYISYAEGGGASNIAVFRRMDEALAWLATAPGSAAERSNAFF